MHPDRRLALATLALSVVLGVATVAVYRVPEAPASGPPPAGAVPAGATVFRSKGCVVCHVGPGTTGEGFAIGPDLTRLAAGAGDRVDGLGAEDYVRQSVVAPGVFAVPGYEQHEMPSLPVSDAELDALVEYLLGSH